ncbi:hypothetical protein A9Q78_02010 [Methylophaga sp. 41_12_T18]|nr:hypothetical protein A9Q78_02010 [Methylophaga sp. 41_12_T18]
MARKDTIESQTYRQQPHSKSQTGNTKAARMAPTSMTNQHSGSSDRLQDAIQTYCDYFIRY